MQKIQDKAVFDAYNKASQHRALWSLDFKPAAQLFGRCWLRMAKQGVSRWMNLEIE